MNRTYCPFEVKTDNDDTGIIRGYGSVFGNIDSFEDSVAFGTFAKTIADCMAGMGNAAATADRWPAGHQHLANTSSPHWRGWLKQENRCLVPFNSFAEYAPEPNPETKKKDVVWFALNFAVHDTGMVIPFSKSRVGDLTLDCSVSVWRFNNG